jgi:hypothetical protein
LIHVHVVLIVKSDEGVNQVFQVWIIIPKHWNLST